MAQITRSTKIGGGTVLQANTLARAADVETDVLGLVNAHNNHDTGTSKWQVVSGENSSSTVILGNNSTGTNDIIDLRDNGTSALKVADGGATTVQAIGAAITALTAAAAAGGTGIPLVVNNSTSTGDIVRFQDNGTAVVTLADGGTLTLAPGGTTKVVANTSGLTLSNSATIAMGSAKITGLANGTASGEAANFSQLHLMQLPVFGSEATGGSTTSATFVAAGASASITPTSASSKILVIGMGPINVATSSDSHTGHLGIARGGTALFARAASPAVQFTGGQSAAAAFPHTIMYLDSPATTSATTYQLMVASGAGSTVNLGAAIGAGINTYIILMEVL